jgi:hypothetical protein
MKFLVGNSKAFYENMDLEYKVDVIIVMDDIYKITSSLSKNIFVCPSEFVNKSSNCLLDCFYKEKHNNIVYDNYVDGVAFICLGLSINDSSLEYLEECLLTYGDDPIIIFFHDNIPENIDDFPIFNVENILCVCCKKCIYIKEKKIYIPMHNNILYCETTNNNRINVSTL